MEKIEIGKMILDTAHAIKQGINASFGGDCIDISGYQMRVLGFVKKHSSHGEMIFQKDIEHEFKIKGSSVTSVLNNLEKNGYILRKSVESDRRLKQIVLTEKAENVCKMQWKAIQKYESAIERGLTSDEIENLQKTLQKIEENIKKIRGVNND